MIFRSDQRRDLVDYGLDLYRAGHRYSRLQLQPLGVPRCWYEPRLPAPRMALESSIAHVQLQRKLMIAMLSHILVGFHGHPPVAGDLFAQTHLARRGGYHGR